jgi:hypothetical protein
MRTRSAVLLSFVLMLVLAIPVSAAPPVVYTGEGEDTYILVNEYGERPCPDFDVYNHVVYSWRSTEYYDNDGNLLRVISHGAGMDNLYNLNNPDVVLSGPYSAVEIYDARTGDWSFPGTYWSITVPGYGTVFKEAGLYKTKTGRLVGIHTSYDPDKMAVFCALLRGS